MGRDGSLVLGINHVSSMVLCYQEDSLHRLKMRSQILYLQQSVEELESSWETKKLTREPTASDG